MTIMSTNHRIESAAGIAGGKPRVAGHRIIVQDIVIWHEWQGRTADEIAAEHGLELADIYAALTYYYEHQLQIDRSIGERDSFVAALCAAIPSKISLRIPYGDGQAAGRIVAALRATAQPQP
jgi:uncharacterized protein (DUF433 family)